MFRQFYIIVIGGICLVLTGTELTGTRLSYLPLQYAAQPWRSKRTKGGNQARDGIIGILYFRNAELSVLNEKLETYFRTEERYQNILPNTGTLWLVQVTSYFLCLNLCAMDSSCMSVFYMNHTCYGYIGGIHDSTATTAAPGFRYAEIAGPEGNIAAMKPTEHSSYSNTYTSNKAATGKRNPRQIRYRTCFQSKRGDMNPFWQVDLQSRAVVLYIGILSRNGCCGERLSEMTIAVSDTSNGTFSQCVYYSGPGYVNEYRVFRCVTPVVGRYVKISREGEYLNFCEVEVFGYFI